MTTWPIWRLLVRVEAWLLAVALYHARWPIHDAFVVPLLIAMIPGGGLVMLWGLSRGASSQRPAGSERASSIELLIAAAAVAAAAVWVARWTLAAAGELRRIDSMLGQTTLVVDVSVTWWSVGACLAALTLDGLLATAHQQLRETMHWLRRMHVLVTVLHLAALFVSAWLLTRAPDLGTVETAAYFDRVRWALHVYEYCKASIFPVQALFGALAIAVVVADSRTD